MRYKVESFCTEDFDIDTPSIILVSWGSHPCTMNLFSQNSIHINPDATHLPAFVALAMVPRVTRAGSPGCANHQINKIEFFPFLKHLWIDST